MKVYKILETSYRYGDENGVTESIFSTPEVRDEFFNLLYKMMKENTSQHENIESKTDDKFEYNDGGKWTYCTEKSDEDLKIIDSFDIDENERFNFKYKD